MVVALKQIREMPPAPETIEASLPWELDAAIMRCLEKDPAQRFRSVEELDAALAAVASPNTTTGSVQVDPTAHENRRADLADGRKGGDRAARPSVREPNGDR